jgi:hypothetical protein
LLLRIFSPVSISDRDGPGLHTVVRAAGGLAPPDAVPKAKASAAGVSTALGRRRVRPAKRAVLIQYRNSSQAKAGQLVVLRLMRYRLASLDA